MPRKDSTKRKPRLRLVTPPEPDTDGREWRDTFLPEGFREGDEIRALCPETDALSRFGLYAGDAAVIFEARDVRPDDLAAVRIDGGLYVGRYRPAPGDYMTFDDGGDVSRFKPGAAELVGRVVHVERRGEIIRRLRPIREAR